MLSEFDKSAGLKSNMDRFIVTPNTKTNYFINRLKSNMDRFIGVTKKIRVNNLVV